MLKKRIIAFACALTVAGSCAFGTTAGDFMLSAEAAGSISETGGASSYNIADSASHYYDNQDKRVFSYMYEESGGILNRVEYISSNLVVEKYDMTTGALKGSKNISLSYSSFSTSPIFGGFFAGKKYNFVVLGQNNTQESDDVPVICVVRFSKDFSQYKLAYIKGCNTSVPFAAGSCRMAEANGKLYIHTCHKMYKSSDGYNHQANMSFVVDEEAVSFEEKYYSVTNDEVTGTINGWGSIFGYSSHSFDQFVALDDNALYAYDHGDAYSRSLRVHRFDLASRSLEYTDLVKINGSFGDNYTGVLTGDMELSSDHVLVGVKMTDMTKSTPDSYTTLKDIYVLNVAKSDIVHTKNSAGSLRLTNYANAANKPKANTAPKMAKINDNKFLVMWSEIYSGSSSSSTVTTTKIAFVNGSGALIGDIKSSTELLLSDCDPILCSDGMVRWYAANNSSPKIYALDPNEPNDFSGGTATPRLPGDADGDGKFGLGDLGRIQQYICDWDVDIDLDAADVNRDGKVNNKDLGLVQMKLADWDVVLL